MEYVNVSFITTVYNEEKTIVVFLSSLITQSTLPREIIIVDGGSTDTTFSLIKEFMKEKIIPITLLEKRGNRSVGRNEAIRKAKFPIIACSDAGCILDNNWMKNIITPFENQKVDVVAGYYKGLGNTVFQKSLIPYVLVMEDKVNPSTFLPATRSMAFKKSVWKEIGGFNEKLSHNEDYDFARRLKKNKANIVFNKDAIVLWIPRENIFDAFIMFFRFAYGDANSLIIRKKVILIFLRYMVGLLFLLEIFIHGKGFPLFFSLILFYVGWSIWKNYRYVKKIQAFYILPILQITSDLAVIFGTQLGIIRYIWDIKDRH